MMSNILLSMSALYIFFLSFAVNAKDFISVFLYKLLPFALGMGLTFLLLQSNGHIK